MVKDLAVDRLVRAIELHQPITAANLAVMLDYSPGTIRSLIFQAIRADYEVCVIGWIPPHLSPVKQWTKLYGIGSEEVVRPDKLEERKKRMGAGKYRLEEWDLVMQRIVRGVQ